ncbi:MAG TPA: DUF4124 domain-containing protein [Steroidobacteraceae bacterium]|nr:DUF4124 domain-containing protein [Steroidobacteraceae bacterium]
MALRRPYLFVGLLAAAAFGAAMAATPSSPTQSVYKWTDEKGVVHYSDAVPAQSADQDATVLNSQGVPVGTVPGRRTPDQLAAEATRRAKEDRAQQAVAQSRQRDQNLLATYLTVEEIEALRDRRADILDGQARVTSAYLEQLRTRQHQLEQQVQRFRPYNTSPNAPQLPEPVAEDLVRTTTDVATQQRNLEIKKQDLANMKAQFASDIARFRELKKIETDYSRGAQPARN